MSKNVSKTRVIQNRLQLTSVPICGVSPVCFLIKRIYIMNEVVIIASRRRDLLMLEMLEPSKAPGKILLRMAEGRAFHKEGPTKAKV